MNISRARFWDLTAVNALQRVLDQIEQRGENVLLLGGDTDTHQTQGGGALRALLVFQQRLDFGHLAQG